MFVSIMCNIQACDIFRELSDQTNGEISNLLIVQLYGACSTQNAIQ